MDSNGLRTGPNIKTWSSAFVVKIKSFFLCQLTVNYSSYILQQEVSVQELLSPSPATDETLWFVKI
jgi:hypothetical protein